MCRTYGKFDALLHKMGGRGGGGGKQYMDF